MMRFLAVWCVGLAAAGCMEATDSSAVSETSRSVESAPVSHGPMLGLISSSGVSVWARTARAGGFFVRYGLSEDAMTSRSPVVATTEATDNTAVVNLQGLKANTSYHYQVVSSDGTPGAGGTFRTLPDSAARRDAVHNPKGLFNFAFEFACGNNQEPGAGLGPSLPAYDTLLRDVKDEIDFAILNGDWLYEEARDYPATQWARDVNLHGDHPEVVRVAPTITGVWQNYKNYMARAENLATWHRHVPTVYTFDDHEIVNDVIACGEAGFRNRRTVFRDIAVKGWFDYLGWANPVEHKQPIHFGRAKLEADSDVLFDPDANFKKIDLAQSGNLHVHWGTPDAGVKDIPAGDTEGGDINASVYDIVGVLDEHRLKIRPAAKADGEVSYSIGRRSYGTFSVGNCQFFLLDTRSHRNLHDIKEPAKKGVTMLGLQQTRWLMHEMRQSKADFMFVVSSVNFMVPHVGGGGTAFDTATKDDAWTVFLEERERLIDFWTERHKPVFVLSGDLHNSYSVRVNDRVWEFASGPHNSVNHRPEDEGDRPVNGPFQYGPRPCEIRWSTTALGDIPRPARMFPHYCVVRINNVFNNPKELGGERWVAYPKPYVMFSFYDGLTGKLRYTETVHAVEKQPASAPSK